MAMAFWLAFVVERYITLCGEENRLSNVD